NKTTLSIILSFCPCLVICVECASSGVFCPFVASFCEQGGSPSEIPAQPQHRGSSLRPRTERQEIREGPSQDRAAGECEKWSQPPQWPMTLDPDTAHPELVLSADRKSVRLGDTQQRVPNNPERFDCNRWVLACEGFTSGRHCWEVEMGDGQCWAVGVARESVRRKRGLSFNPEEGIWAVQWLHGDQYQARTSPETTVSLGRVPSRIRVCLDCDEGQVAFFSADNKAPIFTFPPASFNGERIRPWFCFWDSETQLRLCS
uniref:B30.2/SPRY domain-containing protein n=1 Tax=Chrysemys picta bellii TaxID=8478 RepID=A0A8C3PB24_CHRPI